MHYQDRADPGEILTEARRYARQHAEPLAAVIEPRPIRPLAGPASGSATSRPTSESIPSHTSSNRSSPAATASASSFSATPTFRKPMPRPRNYRPMLTSGVRWWGSPMRRPPRSSVRTTSTFSWTWPVIRAGTGCWCSHASRRRFKYRTWAISARQAWRPWTTTSRTHLPTRRVVRTPTTKSSSSACPNAAFCYLPGPTPEVSPELPARRSGRVMFGCLNNPAKVSDEVLACWSQVLASVPGSCLLLRTGAGRGAEDRIRDILDQHGIKSQRLLFAGPLPTRSAYLELYHTIDISLDPFPYNGVTTTCNALWMGVPVISLGGSMSVSRQGVRFLRNVGLDDLLAGSPEQYVRIATNLAGDLAAPGRPPLYVAGANQSLTDRGRPPLDPRPRGGLSRPPREVAVPRQPDQPVTSSRATRSSVEFRVSTTIVATPVNEWTRPPFHSTWTAPRRRC